MLKLRAARYPFDGENGRTNKEGGKKKEEEEKRMEEAEVFRKRITT